VLVFVLSHCVELTNIVGNAPGRKAWGHKGPSAVQSSWQPGEVERL